MMHLKNNWLFTEKEYYVTPAQEIKFMIIVRFVGNWIIIWLIVPKLTMSLAKVSSKQIS